MENMLHISTNLYIQYKEEEKTPRQSNLTLAYNKLVSPYGLQL